MAQSKALASPNTAAGAVGPFAAEPLPPDPSPAGLYLLRLGSAHSRRTMGAALARIAALASDGQLDVLKFPWHQLRYRHTQLIRARFAADYSPAGANLRLAALRGVLKEAFRLGLMSAEDFHRAADLPSVRGSALPRGRALSAGEIRALFAACEADTSPAGPRDAAFLALLYAGGLRRSEVVTLDLGDYDAEEGQLRVKGKGRRERMVHVHGGAAQALAAWLDARGDAPGPFLCPVDRGGRVEIRRLTSQAVLLACRKRADEAGVDRFSPHDLRRSFIGDLLDAGVDISTVQRMAGHAQVTTTARYDRRPEAQKRKAAQKLHVPYGRRRRGAVHDRS
jgi:site-specific recombinase XerD